MGTDVEKTENAAQVEEEIKEETAEETEAAAEEKAKV